MKHALPLPFLLLLLFAACTSGTGRQEIDLSDQVVKNPDDGIGHYVYALSLPEQIAPGETLEIQMDWRTVGPVDWRKRYAMDILLEGDTERKIYPIEAFQSTVGEGNLINWLNYYCPIPEDFVEGEYAVAVRLRDVQDEGQVVQLGFEPALGMEDGFYRLATVQVAR